MGVRRQRLQTSYGCRRPLLPGSRGPDGTAIRLCRSLARYSTGRHMKGIGNGRALLMGAVVRAAVQTACGVRRRPGRRRRRTSSRVARQRFGPSQRGARDLVPHGHTGRVRHRLNRTDRRARCTLGANLEPGRDRASKGAPSHRSCGQRRRAVARVLPRPARPAWLEGDQAVSDLQGNRGGGLPRTRKIRRAAARRRGDSDCDRPMAALTSTTASASSTSRSRWTQRRG